MGFIKDPVTREFTDTERKAVLTSIRGRPDQTKEFSINWDGKLFGFNANPEITHEGLKPVAISWFIASINLADDLRHLKPQILEIIRDAMMAFGYMGYPNGEKVSVKFDPRLEKY